MWRSESLVYGPLMTGYESLQADCLKCKPNHLIFWTQLLPNKAVLYKIKTPKLKKGFDFTSSGLNITIFCTRQLGYISYWKLRLIRTIDALSYILYQIQIHLNFRQFILGMHHLQKCFALVFEVTVFNFFFTVCHLDVKPIFAFLDILLLSEVWLMLCLLYYYNNELYFSVIL